MNTLQTQITNAGWPLELQILGVNGFRYESGNAAMCSGRSLPWLQEVPRDQVWRDWQVTYRDVIILDAQNIPVGVFNLTEHNLSNIQDFNALKTMLKQAADPNSFKITE